MVRFRCSGPGGPARLCQSRAWSWPSLPTGGAPRPGRRTSDGNPAQQRWPGPGRAGLVWSRLKEGPRTGERLPGREDSLHTWGTPRAGRGWEVGGCLRTATAPTCAETSSTRKDGLQSAAPLEKACVFLRKGQAKLSAEARPAVLLALSEAHLVSGRSLLSLVGPSIRLAPVSRVKLALALQNMGYAEAARDQLRQARQGAEHDAREGLAWWPAGAGWTQVEATAGSGSSSAPGARAPPHRGSGPLAYPTAGPEGVVLSTRDGAGSNGFDPFPDLAWREAPAFRLWCLDQRQ